MKELKKTIPYRHDAFSIVKSRLFYSTVNIPAGGGDNFDDFLCFLQEKV